VSRPLFKRVKEKELRPKALAKLASSINMSLDFLARVKNFSSELAVLTEVEVTTLKSLIQEIQVGGQKKPVDMAVFCECIYGYGIVWHLDLIRSR